MTLITTHSQLKTIAKTALFFVFLMASSPAISQFYTPAQITTIHTAKSALEGNLYLDTVNNNFFIGLTTGELAKIGDTLDEKIDSAFYLNDTLFILEGNDTVFVLVSGLKDHDWYKEGTTESPTSINDTIFTNGEVILKSHPNTRADDTTGYLNVLYTNPDGQIMSGRREIIPPSPFIDVSSASTGNSINMYNYYSTQFTNSGLQVIPVANLDFYVISFDTSVFSNVAISPAGVLTFDVLTSSRTNSCIDVRFYTK
ncbi:MAG: hypothetical protein ABF242_07855 [Flavobacteriales bacterium]